MLSRRSNRFPVTTASHQNGAAPINAPMQQQVQQPELRPGEVAYLACESDSDETPPALTSTHSSSFLSWFEPPRPFTQTLNRRPTTRADGSNMSPAVLTGRRRVTPRLSLPAAVPALRLSFGMLGFPFSEPAFATVLPPSHPLVAGGRAAPVLHGVVHVISRDEWAAICRSEGVGSSTAGYQLVEVQCELYRPGQTYSPSPNAGGSSSSSTSTSSSEGGQQGDGGRRAGVLQAVTLQGAEASLHRSWRGALPSTRYLNLLRTGESAGG